MALPDARVAIHDWIELEYRDPDTNQGVAGAGYEIHMEGGTTLSGVLDDQGRARHENVQRKKVLKVIYKPRQADKDEPALAHRRLLG